MFHVLANKTKYSEQIEFTLIKNDLNILRTFSLTYSTFKCVPGFCIKVIYFKT